MTSSVEDNELPKAIITRIAKRNLPDNTIIQKDANIAIRRAATVFINYLTATANDNARAVNQKSISSAHVLKAMEVIEMEHLVPKMQEALNAFQKASREKRAAYKKSAASRASVEEEIENDSPMEDMVIVPPQLPQKRKPSSALSDHPISESSKKVAKLRNESTPGRKEDVKMGEQEEVEDRRSGMQTKKKAAKKNARITKDIEKSSDGGTEGEVDELESNLDD